jgi:anti-sigma factor RsiW
MDKLTSSVSDRFELLSAYLDGEVSLSERKQVEEWLASDSEFRKTYQQMLALQDGWHSMPAVAPSMPTEQLVNQVMARLDRRNPQRWIWGGLGTAAAIAIGAFSGLFGNQGVVFQTAKGPDPQQTLSAVTPVNSPASTTIAMRASDLMLALDRPPVEIPAVPGSAMNQGADIDPGSNF